MNSISIRWERRAVRELASIEKDDQRRVLAAVEALRDEPLKGEGLSGRWKGFRRLRVGAHRVVYAFDGRELLVFVVRVAHRRDAYR